MGWHDRQKGWGFTLLGCHPALPLSGNFFTPCHRAEYWQPCLYYKFPTICHSCLGLRGASNQSQANPISGPGIWNSAWALSWSVYIMKSWAGIGVGSACYRPPCGQRKQESQSEEKGMKWTGYSNPWAHLWLVLCFISLEFHERPLQPYNKALSSASTDLLS